MRIRKVALFLTGSVVMLSLGLTLVGVMSDLGLIHFGFSLDFISLSQTLVVPSLITLGVLLASSDKS